MPELKVCGVTDAAFACAAARRGVDYLGFIFAEGSPRRITPAKAQETRCAVERTSTTKAIRPRFVGVFVEQTVGEIAEIARSVPLDVIQLHGDYGADKVATLKSKGYEVWRLHRPDGGGLGTSRPTAGTTGVSPVGAGEDAVLLDGRRGAESRRADWSLVAGLKRAGRRVVLAGGISAGNIVAAIATGADIIDINSSIETAPGVKSVEKLDMLLCQLVKPCGDGIPASCKPTSP